MKSIKAVPFHKRIDLILGMLLSIFMIYCMALANKKDRTDVVFGICLIVLFSCFSIYCIFLFVYLSGKITLDDNSISYDVLFFHRKISNSDILSFSSESGYRSSRMHLIVKTEKKSFKLPFEGSEASKFLYDFNGKLFEQKFSQWLENARKGENNIIIEYAKGFKRYSYLFTYDGIRNQKIDVFVPWGNVKTRRVESPDGILYEFDIGEAAPIKFGVMYGQLINEYQIFFDAVSKEN